MFTSDLEKYVENISPLYKIYKNLLFFLIRSSQKLVNPINLFSHANELFINGFTGKSCHLDLSNSKSYISTLVPWTQLRKIRVDAGNVIKASELEAILRMVYNVHTLQIDDSDILPEAIFCDNDNLGTRINERVSSFIEKRWHCY